MSSGREKVLARVKEVLAKGRAGGWVPAAEEPNFIPEHYRVIDKGTDTTALVDRLREQLAALGDTVHQVNRSNAPSLLKEILSSKKLSKGVVQERSLQFLGVQKDYFPGVMLEEPNGKDNVYASQFSLELIDFAIAETGSMGLISRPGYSRLTSVAVETHIAFVHLNNVYADLVDAFEKTGRDAVPGRQWALITGSSRTADIDGILIRGAHGPREVILIVVTD